MELPALKKGKWNYLGIAFAIPAVGMLIVMLISQYAPFGHYSMLYSDMYHQYYPFFVAFRKALLEGNGLLYSWSVGMGMDYLGLISYYLASPLNLLSVLVPEGLLLDYFSLLVPIKLGFAGLFFAIFLKKTFRKNDLSISLFGSFYALCAWALGFQWNVMWLDTFALLPLVALGTVSLLRDKRFFLYTVTLFLSIFTNYYIGFFTCIFVFLLFFCYEICRWQGFRRFFLDLVRIACFSVLAIGMTAILELPALAALQNTQSSVNNFPEGFQLNITSDDTWLGLLDAMRQVAGNMGGGLEPNFKEGLPNLYCGVGSILLAFLFLTSGKVKLRDKLCSVALLLFFIVSFIVRQLDYIWHGFHFTNMIPYRFSFLYSFVLLYMAYRAFLMRRRFRVWQIAVAGILTLLVLFCSDKRTDVVFLSYNLAFFLLYFSVLIYGVLRKRPPVETDEASRRAYLLGCIRRRNTISLVLAGVMALEIILNLVSFGIYFPGTNVSNYPKGTEYAASMIRYMKEREENTPFYRAEVTHSQTLNDGALNGYNGVSTFTSSANVRVTEFMRTLGYGAKNTYNRYCFEESSPVANLFLNLKYMLERDGKVKQNNYFTEIHHYGDVYLLENNAYLPLGFLANTALGEVDFTKSTEPFYFQNDLLTAASGIEGEYWHSISTGNLNITATEGIDLSPMPEGRYCSYICGDENGTVYFDYTADRAGLVCVHLTLSGRNSFRIYKNGEEIVSESYSLPQMLSVCEVVPGDVIEISLSCDAGDKDSMTIRAAILDEALFRQAYGVLAASQLELTKFESTRVEGDIVCDRDGLLYTSIPYDGNWQAQVDGQAVEPVLVGDCMIALPMTQGTHSVAFRYHNAAFSLGWKVSLVCAVIFLALTWLYNPPQLAARKGKYEKKKK